MTRAETTNGCGLHAYKGLQIYISAMPALGVKWRPIGIVSDLSGPDVRELQRIISDETFDTEDAAAGRALELCKAWIEKSGNGGASQL